jgi:hypothetical protein
MREIVILIRANQIKIVSTNLGRIRGIITFVAHIFGNFVRGKPSGHGARKILRPLAPPA